MSGPQRSSSSTDSAEGRVPTVKSDTGSGCPESHPTRSQHSGDGESTKSLGSLFPEEAKVCYVWMFLALQYGSIASCSIYFLNVAVE